MGKLLAVGARITEDNNGAEETEVGTIALVLTDLLRHGIARDTDRSAERDESTARWRFKSLPFIFDPALAVSSGV